MRAFAMAWAAAGALLMAGPASAATFVFDVTLTDIAATNDLLNPGFPVTRHETHAVPLTFQVTFNIQNVFTGDVTPDAGGIGKTQVPITMSPLPIQDDLLAASGLTADQLQFGIFIQETRKFDTLIYLDTTQPDTSTATAYQALNIQFTGEKVLPIVGTIGEFTPQKLDTLFQDLGEFSISAFGVSVFSHDDFDTIDRGDMTEYVGTAVYRPDLSAIPEPASWALMITGFGLAGAVLRRRRAPATT